MKFEELEIKGAFLIHAEPFEDERGVFRRNYCEKEFRLPAMHETHLPTTTSQLYEIDCCSRSAGCC